MFFTLFEFCTPGMSDESHGQSPQDCGDMITELLFSGRKTVSWCFNMSFACLLFLVEFSAFVIHLLAD